LLYKFSITGNVNAYFCKVPVNFQNNNAVKITEIYAIALETKDSGVVMVNETRPFKLYFDISLSRTLLRRLIVKLTLAPAPYGQKIHEWLTPTPEA